jgi:hypothetical protein
MNTYALRARMRVLTVYTGRSAAGATLGGREALFDVLIDPARSRRSLKAGSRARLIARRSLTVTQGGFSSSATPRSRQYRARLADKGFVDHLALEGKHSRLGSSSV